MSIFRAYDIRGIFGKDLTGEISNKIGRAFGTYLKDGTVAVGKDNRLSSPTLRDSLIDGLISSGIDVIDIGTVPTPLLYFSIFKLNTDGGVMITGSHNPPEYNGFKLCKGTDTLYGDEIQEIKKIIDSGEFKREEGKLTEKNIIDDYIGDVKKKITVKRKLKVVIDAGNGTAGIVAPILFRELGCDVIELNCKLDGNFPSHHPDPTIDEYLGELIAIVKEKNADFGVAYDGDADRAGFVDDNGDIIRGDQALILFSREILEKRKNSKIVFEVKCSQALIEDIKEHGGIPIMYKTGHSFIKKKIKDEDSPLAGEMSGHFYFRDNYYGYDDGIFASARMAQLLSKSKEKASELLAKVPKYYSTPEIRIDCPEDLKFKIVDEITKKFKKTNEVITVDGARIQFKDGWGLVRASNTQPALILRFEAKTQNRLEEIKKKVIGELRKFPALNKSL